MSWDYVIKRFLLFLAVIFVAVTINFIIPRLRDTNPIEERLYQLAAQGGVNVSKIKELTAIYEAKYGLHLKKLRYHLHSIPVLQESI